MIRNKEPDAPNPDPLAIEWVIRKGAYYYRENCRGYTADLGAAGRYTKAKAEQEAAVEPWHMEAIHAPRIEVASASELASARAQLDALKSHISALEKTINALVVSRTPSRSIEIEDQIQEATAREAAQALAIPMAAAYSLSLGVPDFMHDWDRLSLPIREGWITVAAIAVRHIEAMRLSAVRVCELAADKTRNEGTTHVSGRHLVAKGLATAIRNIPLRLKLTP